MLKPKTFNPRHLIKEEFGHHMNYARHKFQTITEESLIDLEKNSLH